MRKLSLTKWIISVLTIICFSLNLNAGTRAAAAADGETPAASIQLSTNNVTSHAKLYLYCEEVDGSNDQACRFLIHAICPVKGITYLGAQTSTCTLGLTSITTAAFNGFGGSNTAGSAISGQNSLTSNTVASLEALGSGSHTLAIKSAVGALSGDINDTLISETALDKTHSAKTCLAFASNAVPDIQIDDDTGTTWAAGTDTLFAHLHGDNSAPAAGYELTGWAPEFNRYDVIGANDSAFTVVYTITVDSHNTATSASC